MSRLSLFSGSAIVLMWLITMGFLLRNHYLKPDPVPAFSDESFFGSVEAVQKWRDVEESMIIKNGETPVGASLTDVRQEKQPDDSLTYTADFRINVKVSPLLPQVVLKGRSIMDAKMHLKRFHATADVGPAKFSATGEVDDNLLYLKINKNNDINLQRIDLNGPISLAEAVRPAIGSQLNITSGESLSTPVIDPLTGSNRGTLTITVKDQEQITVDGESISAYRVVSSLADIETIMWVDAYGQTLKRNLVGSFTMEKADREEALKAAPALAEPTVIPGLNLVEFRDVPIQQSADAAGQSPNGAIGTLRTLLQ